jgi:hypothetical protein
MVYQSSVALREEGVASRQKHAYFRKRHEV